MNTISLLSGFLVIFTGVYLLNLSRGDPNGHNLLNGHVKDGVPTDGITGLQTRHSMQIRRSGDLGRASTGSRGERGVLMHSFDEEHVIGHGLGRLPEDSEEDEESGMPRMNGGYHSGYNGTHLPMKCEEQ